MVDPVALTAGVIADLAFRKFLESSAGKLAEKFTESAIVKMDELRKLIWQKLRGRSPKISEALQKAEQGDKEGLGTIAKNLDVVMDEDPAFARQLQMIAHEIMQMQIQDNSSMNQTNYGGNNYQVKTGIDNTNFFGGQHHHGQK